MMKLTTPLLRYALAVLLSTATAFSQNSSTATSAGDKAPVDPNSAEAKKILADTAKKIPSTITSDSLEYDMKKHIAVFFGNVHVEDEQMEMMADKMTLTFNKKNELQKVVAEERVRIKRAAYRATSGHAVYDMANGRLVLTDDPVLVQETNTIRNAEKVIYDKLTGKFRTEGGRPKIDFVVPDDKEFDFFGKEKKKDGADEKKPAPEK